ncbi:PEPxxWA-CTERM sorting domain-containing protein [Altererythrobacter salegens]|uniref:PEPxxWA-CTERM sorting domain-containing protein n=1 Tax=Croceibacterium salegens TaxID=1737568 RepID=A0A6I4SZ76_9SPHN|nr:PEPxxWA-CTERM sorting domain-containing protein [Croceibacterium salegens]MXO61291.1 PEPxxWA-CTERM sorting domain-containing protein [Croceibacterium salegens]
MMKAVLVAIATACFAAHSPTHAAVLLDVGGPAHTGMTLHAGEAGAASFTLSKTASNVSIVAPLFCLDCQGSLWLHRNSIGSTASFGDVIQAMAFDGATGSPYFTIASLDPGLYFLIAAQDEEASGTIIWQGSATPLIASGGATRGVDFYAQETMPFVPFSEFGVIFGTNLSFKVTGQLASSVPEPSTWALLLLGFLVIGFVLRRHPKGGAGAVRAIAP